MLSGENPPPDPPNLNNEADDIDLLPTRNKLPLAELDSGIDHRLNFSIRDYVFTARSKDIKNNWPFSLKNLQLCLKHGVKDPLPPFQPLEAVKNQPLNRCHVERVAAQVEKQNTYKILDGVPSGSNRHVVAEPCSDAGLNHHDKAVGSLGNSGCDYENDQFPSTATSQSEIDSIPISKSSSGSAPLEAAGPSLKPQKPTAKKSRLIVKFGGTSDRSSAEDFATPSESMASKICPVCKTFSSSSNTTLNAHIDQCLSAESTPKWTADSKLSRHRIKPRKVKLMVDIYVTAKRCTLEELDRRNGTSWAAAVSSVVPNRDAEMIGTSNGGNDSRAAVSSKPESSDDVGAVYIDASGTKLRILSKSSDAMPAVSKSGDYLGPKKSLKGAKASELLSNKRKRLHGMKHQKYLKLALQSRKFFSHNGHTSKMVGREEEHNEAIRDHFRSEDHQVRKQILSSKFSSLRERAHMKRSCNPRKANDQDGHRPLSWKQHSSPDVQVQNDLSCSDDPFVEMNHVQKFKKLPQSTFSSHENCQRIRKPHCEGQQNDQRAHSSRKRLRSPLVVSGVHDKVESFSPTKKNVGGPHARGIHMLKPLKSQSSSKKVSIAAINYSGTQRTGNSTRASETLKCSSSKKHVLSSTSRPPMVGSRSNLGKNHATKTKMDVHIPEDDRAVAWHSKLGERQFELTDDEDGDDTEDQRERDQTTEELSSGRGNIRGVTEREAALSVSDREGTDVSSSSPSASHCYSLEDARNTDSSPRNMVEIIENTESMEFGEGTATSLNKSVETKSQKMNNPCLSRSNTLPTTDDYNGHIYGGEGLASMGDSRFVDKRQMFCDEEIAAGLIGQSAHIGADMDSETVERDSFPVVDPIPIPGPPGSFLPSPRDMGSEDFQGNSSLTTSRVQSSQEQFDLVDGESSDSPLSAVSNISDPMALGSTRKRVEPSSSACVSEVQEKNRPGFSSASNEQSAEDTGLKNHEPERILLGENFKVTRIPTERRPFIFKNDNQPCCCQRKERFSQGLSLNFQESQLLRRRTVASAVPSPIEVQVIGDQNVRCSNLDLMPGVFPFGSSPSYGSENSSITRPPPSGPPSKGFSDGVSKFAGPTDRDSASPSSSNPVLRLMGKNLVVNKEDASLPLDHATSQPPTSSGVSPSTNRYQDGQFLQHAVSQGSSVYDQNPHIMAGQSFDPRPLNGFRNHGDLATPEKLVQLSAGMLPEWCVDHGFMSPAVSVKLEGNRNTSIWNSRLKNKKGQVPSFNMENFTSIDHRYRNADAAVLPKEIIIIDDAPENETSNTSAAGRHGEGLRENHMISSGTSAATFPAHGVIRHANSFSSYQSQESSPWHATRVPGDRF